MGLTFRDNPPHTLQSEGRIADERRQNNLRVSLEHMLPQNRHQAESSIAPGRAPG